MANQEHLKILAKGVDAWNRWRKNNPDLLPDLRLAYLNDVILPGADFSNTDFSGADLSRANASAAIFSEAKLHEADFRRANLTGANLTNADLTDCYMWGVNLAGANLTDVDLSGSILLQAELQGANLTGATLAETELLEANFSNANCSGAEFSGADFSGANLGRANLCESDLSWANLNKANLREVNFSRANLSGADLCEADLSGANLNKANLREAHLIRANLSGADLCEADLSEANFSKANLREANLIRANLSDADLSGAVLEDTRFQSISALNTLELSLTQEQLLGCIFVEKDEARRQRAKAGKEAATRGQKPDILRFDFGNGHWTPLDFSLFFLAVQATANRLQYLLTSQDFKLSDIRHVLSGPCYPEERESIYVRSFSMQSPGWIEFAYEAVERVSPIAPVVLGTIASAVAMLTGIATAWDKIQAGNLKRQKAKGQKIDNKIKEFDLENKIKAAGELLDEEGRQNMVTPSWRRFEPLDLDALGHKISAPRSFKTNNPIIDNNKDELFGQAVAALMSSVRWLVRQGMKPRAKFKPKPKRKGQKRPPIPR